MTLLCTPPTSPTSIASLALSQTSLLLLQSPHKPKRTMLCFSHHSSFLDCFSRKPEERMQIDTTQPLIRAHVMPPNLQINIYERLFPDSSTVYRVHQEHGDGDRDLVFDYTLTREAIPSCERPEDEKGVDWVMKEERSVREFNSKMSGGHFLLPVLCRFCRFIEQGLLQCVSDSPAHSRIPHEVQHLQGLSLSSFLSHVPQNHPRNQRSAAGVGALAQREDELPSARRSIHLQRRHPVLQLRSSRNLRRRGSQVPLRHLSHLKILRLLQAGPLERCRPPLGVRKTQVVPYLQSATRQPWTGTWIRPHHTLQMPSHLLGQLQ